MRRYTPRDPRRRSGAMPASALHLGRGLSGSANNSLWRAVSSSREVAFRVVTNGRYLLALIRDRKGLRAERGQTRRRTRSRRLYRHMSGHLPSNEMFPTSTRPCSQFAQYASWSARQETDSAQVARQHTDLRATTIVTPNTSNPSWRTPLPSVALHRGSPKEAFPASAHRSREMMLHRLVPCAA